MRHLDVIHDTLMTHEKNLFFKCGASFCYAFNKKKWIHYTIRFIIYCLENWTEPLKSESEVEMPKEIKITGIKHIIRKKRRHNEKKNIYTQKYL